MLESLTIGPTVLVAEVMLRTLKIGPRRRDSRGSSGPAGDAEVAKDRPVSAEVMLRSLEISVLPA